jgi:hypothetical protein
LRVLARQVFHPNSQLNSSKTLNQKEATIMAKNKNKEYTPKVSETARLAAENGLTAPGVEEAKASAQKAQEARYKSGLKFLKPATIMRADKRHASGLIHGFNQLASNFDADALARGTFSMRDASKVDFNAIGNMIGVVEDYFLDDVDGYNAWTNAPAVDFWENYNRSAYIAINGFRLMQES